MLKILVVDDDQDLRLTIAEFLRSLGHQVEEAEGGEQAVSQMKRAEPDLLLTDLRMDGLGGLELLNRTREYFPAVNTVIMTAESSIPTAVEAIRNGAYDYLVKPLELESLELLMARLTKFQSLRAENLKLRDHVGLISPPGAITSSNPKMLKLLDIATRVATTDSTLLITGESGTGKTMLAKMVHDQSLRVRAPFAVVNCATLSENLLESELFGHVKGSFTGAVRDKMGRLQVAEGGTVFLDEIGEISPSLQTKLLRFLQDREFERVGDTKTIHVDVRVIAATNKDLEREVEEGRFREDLYFRLNVIDLRMPSLRDRSEDLPALIQHLLAISFATLGKERLPLSPGAEAALRAYSWPGNIRELKNALERAAILCTGAEVRLEDLPDRVHEGSEAGLASIAQSPVEIPLNMSLDELERIHIENVLGRSKTLEEAASILGINLSTLWRKRRLYKLAENGGSESASANEETLEEPLNVAS